MAQRTQTKYELKENDFYETPTWVTAVLADYFKMVCPDTKRVLEPCCGNGKMSNELERHGFQVSTNDLNEYSYRAETREDFLNPTETNQESSIEFYWSLFDAIIMNPPYGNSGTMARKFVEQALRINGQWVAALLTANFDSGKTRSHLFKDNPRFFGKIVLLDRISWMDNGIVGSTDHAWYIWRPINHGLFHPIIEYRYKD